MNKPRLLDLFCCQGGAAVGYHRAGFDVTGVDLEPQPLYPFTFHQGDALEFVSGRGSEFDAIHASPPCQAHTSMSNRYRGQGGKADSWPDLIAPTRAALIASGKPWVLENVTGARSSLLNPFLLHGGMFGLTVDRPRLFETNIPILSYPAPKIHNPVGVYGKHHDGRRLFTRKDGTSQYAAASVEEAREAMGMPWADWNGLREAIPPAYSEFIGLQLIDALEVAA